MKSLNISTKVIIPVFIIGIITSLTSFYYINEVLQNLLKDEIQEKVQNKLDHIEDYIENEFKLFFYLDGSMGETYKFKEEISKKSTINLLKKDNKNSKDIIYIVTEKKNLQITPLGLSKNTLESVRKGLMSEYTINGRKYSVITAHFKPWDWEIVILHDISNFEKILYENQAFIFTLTLILLASLVIVLIVIFHLNINKPLNILFKHFQKISKGQYDVIKHSFNSKEFDQLVSFINVMTLAVEVREKDAKNLLAKTKENEDYIYDILNSQEDIIIVRDSKEIQTMNNAFFKLFPNFKNIKDFKKHHNSIGEYFEEGEDLVYNFKDKNWIDYVLNNKEKLHKVKIKQNDKEYIFALNVIKSQKYPRVIISLTNITELEKSNNLLEQYKKAVDAAAIVSKTNKEGLITYVNENFVNISGYKKEDLLGKDHNLLRSPNVPNEVFKDLWKTIKAKQIWQGEFENINKKGEKYYVSASIAPIINSENEITEFIGIRHNITDQVLAKERALKAEEAKGLFLANMSHEIRTPLNAIIGFTKILTNMSLDDKTGKYIGIIDKSAHNLLGIVNDILDLSKIETGNITLEQIEFNPFEEFDSVINLFSAKTQEKNLKLIYFIDPNIPQEILGDPLRLKQVLSNIISNAIKFTQEGYVSVRIDLISKKEHTCKIEFSIEDTGIGIKKDKQKQIFSAFSQADNSISREFGGTGLGLSISAKIIQAFNSKINLNSTLDKGSQFNFTIDFKTYCNENQNLKKFKNIKTAIYDSSNIDSLLLPTLQEYLNLITLNTSIKKKDIEKLEKQDIIFISEGSINDEIIALSEKGCKLIIIANKEKSFDQIKNSICLTLPLNLSVLFNILIESIDKKNIIPIKENQKNYTKYDANILVVEDHKINQELITILLELRNIKYKIANNGQEAIDMFKEEKFDLILMDINMPVKNGIDSSKEIIELEKKQKLKHTTIVALSANAIDSQIENILSIGIDDYLYKPIDETMLDNILNKYLTKKETITLEVNSINTKAFNIEETSKKLGLNSMIVKKLMRKFCDTIDLDLETLDKAINTNDSSSIANTAHKIKGAALNLRMEEVSKYSSNLETNALNSNYTFSEEFNKLKKAVDEIKKVVNE